MRNKDKPFTFEMSLEMSEFMDRVTPEEVDKIVQNYHLKRRVVNQEPHIEVHVRRMLAHALWVGFCRGKGWD